MRWLDLRVAYPEQWLVIEALDAHSTGGRRVLERVAVIEACPDGPSTLHRYRDLRRQYPHREFCFVHTSARELEIEERRWLGLRGLGAADPAR